MDDVVSLDILYADEYVPEELYQLVQDGLYSQLDTRLDELSNSAEYLTALRWHGQQKLSLLMIAALNGSDEIVRVLLKHCHTKCQIELKGQVILYDGKLIKDVTALYCACYRGHFTVAKTLIEIGQANVKHGTQDHPDQPLLINAIKRNREDIIHFLLENKYVDVNETIPDAYYPSTALIWAVYQGSTSIVKYFIENGADVNYSTQKGLMNSSAVMCATFWSRLDILRLLVNADANINIKDKTGNTLLIIAAEHKNHTIVRFLLEQSINHSVDDLELAACYLFNISSSIERVDIVFDLLKLALEQRQSLQMNKVCIEPMHIYDYQQECQTIDELNRIKNDRDRIFIETLLIRERMYSSGKKISITEPLANYADRFEQKNEFDKCFDISIRIFDLTQQIEPNNNNLAQFVWLFCKMMTKNQLISIQRFIQASSLTFQLTKIKSVDITLSNALFLVIIADKILQEKRLTKEEKMLIYSWIRDLCRHQLTTQSGKTLLHLCVDQNTNSNLNFRPRDTTIHIKFPNQSGLRLLLFCGIRWLDVNARESTLGSTPLHLICTKNPDENIIELLLNNGSHIDCINKVGKIPFDYLNDKRIKTLFETKRTPNRLKCLCARIIARKHFNTSDSNTFTSALNKFIFLHTNLSTQDLS